MLQVVVEHTADTVVLRCVGRIVAGEEVHALQDTVVSHTDKHVVLLDLAGVDSIDAAGLGLLMFFQTLGRALVISSISRRPSRLRLRCGDGLRRFDVVRTADLVRAHLAAAT